MPHKIVACPFCGGNEFEYEEIIGGYLHQYRVVCKTCEARGQAKGTKAAARNAWNKRVEAHIHCEDKRHFAKHTVLHIVIHILFHLVLHGVLEKFIH